MKVFCKLLLSFEQDLELFDGFIKLVISTVIELYFYVGSDANSLIVNL